MDELEVVVVELVVIKDAPERKLLICVKPDLALAVVVPAVGEVAVDADAVAKD